MNASYLGPMYCVTPVGPLSAAILSKSCLDPSNLHMLYCIYISESDKSSKKKKKYWNCFHKLAAMRKWTIYKARKEEWDIKEVMWSKVNEIIISTGWGTSICDCASTCRCTQTGTDICVHLGMRKDISEPPGSKFFRGNQTLQDSAWHCQYMME